jgi:Matrixin
MTRTVPAGVLALVVALCATLTVAVDARANVPPRREVVRAQHVAQRVWHPSCGRLHASFDDPRTANTVLDDGTPIDYASGWAMPGDCTIHLSRAQQWVAYPPLCEVVLHEAGHVAGRGHSHNPRSIMYPQSLWIRTIGTITRASGRPKRVVRWSGIDHRCLR